MLVDPDAVFPSAVSAECLETVELEHTQSSKVTPFGRWIGSHGILAEVTVACPTQASAFGAR